MMPILNPAGVQEIIDYGLYGFAHVALRRHLGGDQMRQGQRRIDGLGRRLARRLNIVVPGVRHAAGRPQHPPRDRHARPGGAAARVQACRRRRLHPRQRARTASSIRAAATRSSASSRSARAISTCARRWTTSASTRWRANRSRHPAVQGRLPLAARRRAHLPTSPRGLETIVVVEEKRSLIEVQVRESLYGTANAAGHRRQEGRARRLAVPGQGRARPQRDRHRHRRAHPRAHRPVERDRRRGSAQLKPCQAMLADDRRNRRRARPIFCSGCPHNTSTVVPEGIARLCRHRLPLHGAVDGPQHRGLHRRWAARARNWVGEAPFSTRGHVFQNIGDGTYNHSGMLAIRAARRAGVNITYKILFNDAVAMTGGQPHRRRADGAT